MKILMIEDEPFMGKIVQKVLRNHGLNDADIEQVTTCDDGLAVLRVASYDIILLDQRMAGKNGLRCLKEIRQEHANIPVVMLTADETPELKSACMEAGADDFVRKDKITILLSHVIWSATERRKARCRIEEDVARRTEVLRNVKSH